MRVLEKHVRWKYIKYIFHIVHSGHWSNCRIHTGNSPWIQNVWDQEKRTEKPVWNYGLSSYSQNTGVVVSCLKIAAAWLASTCVSLPLYVESLLSQFGGKKKKTSRSAGNSCWHQHERQIVIPCLGKSLRANWILQILVLFRILCIVKVVLLSCAAQEKRRQWQPVNFKS